jgi:nicotinamide-nucleotide amidase
MRNQGDIMPVYSESVKLYALLQQFDQRLVLAESCTAGLVAAELGRIPGISNHFCGSLVVYRNDAKVRWLGIDPAVLEDPEIGPVSPRVTESLAVSALRTTPEATLAGAITGHLGPGAPESLDGIVYCAIATRAERIPGVCTRLRLETPRPKDQNDFEGRARRQAEAAKHMIMTLQKFLDREPQA